MSIKPQKCSLCKLAGHNKSNCPGPQQVERIVVNNQLDVNSILVNQEVLDEEDYFLQRKELLIRYRKILKKLEKNRKRAIGEDYFFRNVKELCTELHSQLINNKEISSFVIIAPPGSGKTMIMDCLAYLSKVHDSDEDCIYGDRFSVFTGMSSVVCRDQIQKDLFFVKEEDSEFKVFHNPDIYKRINYLIENVMLLKNHIFLIDEAHIACLLENTIAKEFERLGLTSEVVKQLNIKFILVSATPDIIIRDFVNAKHNNCRVLMMKPGPDYKGFNYFNIIDYRCLNKKENRELLIENILGLDSPKHHVIRVKGLKNVEELRKDLLKEGFLVREYNQETSKRICLDDEIEKEPSHHTVWFIKDMLRASKRLRINKFIGVIIEPYGIEDVTVTAQGLIPRWFGYYTPEELKDCNPIFICNKKAVEKYKLFLKTGTYENFNYLSRNIRDKNAYSHQVTFVEPKECKTVSEFDQAKCDNLDFFIEIMSTKCDGLPSNNSLGSLHQTRDGYWISTKYCDKLDKSIVGVIPENYRIITTTIIEKAGMGKNLGKNPGDNKIIFIPVYNDQLELSSLQWYCRYYKELIKTES